MIVREPLPLGEAFDLLVNQIGGPTKVRPAYNARQAAEIITEELRRLKLPGSVSCVQVEPPPAPKINVTEAGWLDSLRSAVKRTTAPLPPDQKNTADASMDDVFFDSDGVLNISVQRVAVFDGQPREYLDEIKMQELELSISAMGQLTPVLVRPLDGDVSGYLFALIDGERRFRTCKKLGFSHIKGTVRTVKDKAEQYRLSAISNFCHAEHPPLEIYKALRTIREEGLPVSQIAALFGKSEQWVYQYLSFDRLHPDVRALMHPSVPKAKRVGVSTALLLAALPYDQQPTAAQKISGEGMRQSDVQAMVETMKGQGKPAQKPPRKLWEILKNFLDRAASGLSQQKRIRAEELTRVFASRTAEEHQECLDALDRLIGGLTSFRQLVRSVRPVAEDEQEDGN